MSPPTSRRKSNISAACMFPVAEGSILNTCLPLRGTSAFPESIGGFLHVASFQHSGEEWRLQLVTKLFRTLHRFRTKDNKKCEKNRTSNGQPPRNQDMLRQHRSSKSNTFQVNVDTQMSNILFYDQRRFVSSFNPSRFLLHAKLVQHMEHTRTHICIRAGRRQQPQQQQRWRRAA